MMDESSSWEPASLFKGYPGMAYALALARRAQETADKSSVRARMMASRSAIGALGRADQSRIIRKATRISERP
jgi:hypothetical protein